MFLHAIHLPDSISKERPGHPTARRRPSNSSPAGGHGSEMPGIEQRGSCALLPSWLTLGKSLPLSSSQFPQQLSEGVLARFLSLSSPLAHQRGLQFCFSRGLDRYHETSRGMVVMVVVVVVSQSLQQGEASRQKATDGRALCLSGNPNHGFLQDEKSYFKDICQVRKVLLEALELLEITHV